jgi:nucleoside-diphosphate-sugar epimerase
MRLGATGFIDIITGILVTRTEGYLGSLLALELIRQDYEVIGLDTGFYKERPHFTELALALLKSVLMSTTPVECRKA